jgi:Sulfotransferase domain
LTRPAPDFVIAGAPKCGTTSIYLTLQSHPGLFLPAIKEPHYFAFEYKQDRAVESSEDYDRLFAEAGTSQLRGDGSVMYLSSPSAIPAVLQRRADVKVIASVRNPIDLFVSWHNQCLKNLDEDVTDPERAWRLQDLRAEGQLIPRSCNQPRSLQYRNICRIGAQIQRLFELVPEHQRLVLVFDELERDPRASYKRVVDFLGIQDDGRSAFSNENAFARPKSRVVARVARAVQIYRPLKALRLRAKPFLNRRGIYWVENFFHSNLIGATRPALSEAFRRELLAEFLPDILLLEGLLQHDLSEWRRDPATLAHMKRSRQFKA